MIAPLRFGLMAIRTTIPRFPSLNLKTYLTKLEMNPLHTLKTFSTKYDIACNTLIRRTIIFLLLKKYLWDKSQGCRLPGKFFGTPKKGGGTKRKIIVLKPLQTFTNILLEGIPSSVLQTFYKPEKLYNPYSFYKPLQTIQTLQTFCSKV